ncbi:restriction endonuclease subunit S [Mycobacterium marseillense]|uniref:restriction endonuclease subunit S n=1 Tax=Mycobacterium marseillense TaxID=701042 RepID=UPI0019D546D1|nr:restriction endonuclease subunit S [Mycobacterium marseillense]
MKLRFLSELVSPAGSRAGSDASYPVYSVTKHEGFIPSEKYFKKQIFSRDLAHYRRVRPGDFAYATIHLDEGSIGIAPADGLISPMYTVFRPHEELVDPQYLVRFMKSPMALGQYPRFGKGSVHRRKSISLESLGQLRVPLPQLSEQRRIAAVLERFDHLRLKRRNVIDQFDLLAQSAFNHAFSEHLYGAKSKLGDLADVASGITKGRRTSEATRPIPYLAVANVQAGHLELGHVKEIEATRSEIERYALSEGDLVLTEGGDPDKLGRGTVWRGELPVCLHQNHIFRVRVTDPHLEPEYLSAYLASRPAKDYFLRAAKQTTGIASINMTQLRATPVYVPPIDAQQKYLQQVRGSDAVKHSAEAQAEVFDELFAALQSRAFSGQL